MPENSLKTPVYHPTTSFYDVLTFDEAASLLRISRPTLRELVIRNIIPARKLGKQWRFHRQSVIDFLSGKDLVLRSRSKNER